MWVDWLQNALDPRQGWQFIFQRDNDHSQYNKRVASQAACESPWVAQSEPRLETHSPAKNGGEREGIRTVSGENDNFKGLISGEKCAYVCFRASFFPNKDSVPASFVALCAAVWRPCVCSAYASELLSLPPPLWGVSLDLFTSSSCCCLLVGLRGCAEPRLSHSYLAPLHSSNNANYISNGNRWGLVSSSHCLERFTNIHQRSHWSAWAPSFKGPDFRGSSGASLANYSSSSTLLPCAEQTSSRISSAALKHVCP